MNAESKFNSLGVNAIVGIDLMEQLGVSNDELSIPEYFAKFQYIVDYLKQFSPDTQRFLINKATRGKLVDKIDHMCGYIDLLEKKSQTKDALEAIDKEMEVLGMSADSESVIQFQDDRDSFQSTLDQIDQELAIYER